MLGMAQSGLAHNCLKVKRAIPYCSFHIASLFKKIGLMGHMYSSKNFVYSSMIFEEHINLSPFLCLMREETNGDTFFLSCEKAVDQKWDVWMIAASLCCFGINGSGRGKKRVVMESMGLERARRDAQALH